MSALTLTAAVLWTFQPFQTIQEAHRFMDSLPATACAQISWGQAQTDAEMAQNREDARLEQATQDAAKADLEACRRLKARIGVQTADRPTPKLKPKSASWKQDHTSGGIPLNSVECNEFYGMSILVISQTRLAYNRWIISYLKEKP